MLKPSVFGCLSDGREVTEYTLRNQFGIVVNILNYGGIIRVLEVPDKSGRSADIVLGFDELSRYERAHPSRAGSNWGFWPKPPKIFTIETTDRR